MHIHTTSVLMEASLPLDRGARWATVHGVAKSRTQLSGQAQRPAHITKACPCAQSLQSDLILYGIRWTDSINDSINSINSMDCTHHVPRSRGFSRQEYWNGLPCPPPGDPLNPGDQTRVS